MRLDFAPHEREVVARTGGLPPPALHRRPMPHLLLVMLGGAIGAALRYLVGLATLRGLGSEQPWGTLIVNLSGGLLAVRAAA